MERQARRVNLIDSNVDMHVVRVVVDAYALVFRVAEFLAKAHRRAEGAKRACRAAGTLRLSSSAFGGPAHGSLKSAPIAINPPGLPSGRSRGKALRWRPAQNPVFGTRRQKNLAANAKSRHPRRSRDPRHHHN
jgi:hypothetical protein